MGPPASLRDGSSTGQRHYCWTSILQEADPVSDAVDRSFIQDELIPVAALRAAEESHLGGSLPDLGGILVQSLLAGDDLPDAVRGAFHY